MPKEISQQDQALLALRNSAGWKVMENRIHAQIDNLHKRLEGDPDANLAACQAEIRGLRYVLRQIPERITGSSTDE